MTFSVTFAEGLMLLGTCWAAGFGIGLVWRGFVRLAGRWVS